MLLADLLWGVRAGQLPVVGDCGDGDLPRSKSWLARRLGVSQALIVRYENAEIDPFEIRLEIVTRLARLMGVPVDHLVRFFETGSFPQQQLVANLQLSSRLEQLEQAVADLKQSIAAATTADPDNGHRRP